MEKALTILAGIGITCFVIFEHPNLEYINDITRVFISPIPNNPLSIANSLSVLAFGFYLIATTWAMVIGIVFNKKQGVLVTDKKQ